MASELLDRVRVGGAVPSHVAVIMDGNGRWARERGLPRHLGHREGMKSVREVVEGAVEAGVGLGWHKYADDVVGIERFGASAPGSVALDRLGMNVDDVVARATALLAD